MSQESVEEPEQGREADHQDHPQHEDKNANNSAATDEEELRVQSNHLAADA